MIKNTSPILAALRQAANSEALAVAFMESQRWGNAPACPRCGSAAVYQMKGNNYLTQVGPEVSNDTSA